MKRTPLQSDPAKIREFVRRGRENSTRKRQPVGHASPGQRLAVMHEVCMVCGRSPCDPCHLIDRALLTDGQDDPRAVVPLDRGCHRDYDEGRLDLLPYESKFRTQMAFAVERYGLLRTLERVSNCRWREAA